MSQENSTDLVAPEGVSARFKLMEASDDGVREPADEDEPSDD